VVPGLFVNIELVENELIEQILSIVYNSKHDWLLFAMNAIFYAFPVYFLKRYLVD